MIKRLVTLRKRKQRARKFGLCFKRAATFTLPSEIFFGARPLSFSFPKDSGTQTAFIDVLLDDCYRLRELPDSISTVVDIGCHVGLFSIAARSRWSQAIIHAYEPNIALKCHWQHHAAQAGFSVYQEAVGITSGKVALVPNPDSVQVRTVETDVGMISQVAFQEVLDRLGGGADLVKLDCEGAEWPILQDEAPWKRVRFLTMEFHLWAGYTIEELRACLKRNGFQIQHLKATGPDFGMLLARQH